MLTDYHMHLEYGQYDEDWVKHFFDYAQQRGISEIGFSEHSHAFKEFQPLYEEDLILDDSVVGRFQRKWLDNPKTKFIHTLEEYVQFVQRLKDRQYPVKLGLEMCNLSNQAKVHEILSQYDWDYLIVSIHFIKGWGFDFAALKERFEQAELHTVWEDYVEEIEKVVSTGQYDILGHPFNLRLFEHIPSRSSVSGLLDRTAQLLKNHNMVVDVNTGTKYRYPIQEISPYADFMELVKKYEIPIIVSSDAHYPEHVGMHFDKAVDYVRQYDIGQTVRFQQRRREPIPIE